MPARPIGYKHNVTAKQVEVGDTGNNTTEQHLQALKCTAAVVAAYLSAGTSAVEQQASLSEYSSCKLEWTPDKGAEYPLGHGFGIAQCIVKGTPGNNGTVYPTQCREQCNNGRFLALSN